MRMARRAAFLVLTAAVVAGCTGGPPLEPGKIDLSVVRDCITTGRKARLLEWLGEVIEDEAV